MQFQEMFKRPVIIPDEWADPGFTKIRAISDLAVWLEESKEEKTTSFPREWEDEQFFRNWVVANVFAPIKLLEEETVKKAVYVIRETRCISKYYLEGDNFKVTTETIQKEKKREEKAAKEKKEEERLANEKKKQEKLDKEQNHR
ncbi:hypothetical protein ACHAPT_009422 [Fusarium lateritium]